jgi:hypothetical protein
MVYLLRFVAGLDTGTVQAYSLYTKNPPKGSTLQGSDSPNDIFATPGFQGY